MGRTPYDHAAVAAQVLEHLAVHQADLTVYELARALGYTYRSTSGRAVNSAKIATALAELADAGRVLRYEVPWPCRGGYKSVWHAICLDWVPSGRT